MAANVNDLINGAYVTIFNRAADPQGANTFWPTFLGLAPTAPGTVDIATTLGNAFFQVPAGNQAFNALYPASISNSQFITQLYLNLGNSVPDAQGLQFWLGQLSVPGATRAGVAADISFVLQTFDPTAASFLALTPDQQQAAISRAATYQNKIAVSEALAATNNSAFNPTAVGDAAYTGAVQILQGVNQTDTSRTIALQQINAANAASNPALLVGQGLTIFLTTGLDVPPATETAQNNAVYFAPDVFQAGLTTPTLNPGDKLVDTGKNGTLQIITAGGEVLTGFTTTGIPNVNITNTNQFFQGGTTVNFAQSSGLAQILTHDNLAPLTFTGVTNLVDLEVAGQTKAVTLTYLNAVTGVQQLGLTNVTTTSDITFAGANAPSQIAVHLTGANTVDGIVDFKLTALTVDSTDTLASNLGTINDGANHTLLTANLSGANGALTVAFGNDSFVNGAIVTLGVNDTLTIGQSNNAGHQRDVINVNGQAAGVYNITLGNQDDHINLGPHSAQDTLTFIHPWGANSATPQIPEMVSGANLSVDQLNFNVSGFRSAGPNPAAAGGLIQTGNGFTGTSTLLHAGNASLNASAVVALETASQYNYDGLATGTGSHVMSAGQNIIRDTNALDSTAAAVATHIYGALTTSITYSTAPGTSAAGTFLVAYQATDGVHIAEAYVVATTGSTNHNTFVTPGVIGNVHDIIDLVGTTLSTFSSAHIAFT